LWRVSAAFPDKAREGLPLLATGKKVVVFPKRRRLAVYAKRDVMFFNLSQQSIDLSFVFFCPHPNRKAPSPQALLPIPMAAP
jgi:hypothetical protein